MMQDHHPSSALKTKLRNWYRTDRPSARVAQTIYRPSRRLYQKMIGYGEQHYTVFQKQVLSKCFLDIAGQEVTLVVGSARSGTTWVQELINYQQDHRVLFEPFAHAKVPFIPPQLPRCYLRPGANYVDFAAKIQRVLAGRLRDPWVDRFTAPLRLYRRRLLKEIRMLPFLRWLYEAFPDLKIVYVMRHPCAVAASWLRLQWPNHPNPRMFFGQPELVADYLTPFLPLVEQTEGKFEQSIFFWALENYVPLQQFRAGEFFPLFYEELCTTPEVVLPQLCDFLGLAQKPALDEAVKRPSALAKKHSAIITGASLIHDWQTQVTPAQTQRAVSILRQFGLDTLYNSEPMPNRATARQWPI